MMNKVEDLVGRDLDWAVCKAEGTHNKMYAWKNDTFLGLEYSTDWRYAGEIIEREKINLQNPRGFGWVAEMWMEEVNPKTHSHFHYAGGDTAILAAMRCYVKSRLGDEVAIPKGLNYYEK